MNKVALKVVFGVLAVGAFMSVCVSASADDKSPAPAITGGAQAANTTHQMKEIRIVGRPNKPLAATEVSTLPMKSTLTELKQPLAGRVEQPVAATPF